MSAEWICEEVRKHISDWVDARLDAQAASVVEPHLQECPTCRNEFAAMRELSRRVADVEPDELPADFAARVREAALRPDPQFARSHRWAHPMALRLAAAAMVILGFVLAYDLGREHGQTTSRSNVAVAQPVASDSPTHMRAARSVASDLSVIDRIPEKMRRPMLRAQFEHFELERWADEVQRQQPSSEPVRDLAALIRGLGSVLDDEARFVAELDGLRSRALRPSLWQEIDEEDFAPIEMPDASGRRDRRSRSVRLAAKHMSPVEVSGLDRLLEFKEHLAFGNPWPFITMGEDQLDLPSDLRPSIEVMIASSLGAVGLDELAAPWMQPLQQGSPDVFELMTATIFDGRNPTRGTIRIGGSDLEQRLRTLFDKSQGSGDIVIKESSEDGGYSFQVFIRTEKKDD